METILAISIPLMFVFGLIVGSYGEKIKTNFYRKKIEILERFIESREKTQKELLQFTRELIEESRKKGS